MTTPDHGVMMGAGVSTSFETANSLSNNNSVNNIPLPTPVTLARGMLADECPNCLEVLRDPRLLPCLHTLCLLCCQDVVDVGSGCPLCGGPVLVDDVAKLPSNVAAQRYPAYRWLPCSVHPDCLPSMFCKDCLLTVCEECARVDHDGHFVVDAEQASSVCLNKLKEEASKLQSCLLHVYDLISSPPDDLVNHICQDQITVTGHVTNAFNSVINNLQQNLASQNLASSNNSDTTVDEANKKTPTLQELMSLDQGCVQATSLFKARRDSLVMEVESFARQLLKDLDLHRELLRAYVELGQAAVNQARAIASIQWSIEPHTALLDLYKPTLEQLLKLQQAQPMAWQVDHLHFRLLELELMTTPIDLLGCLLVRPAGIFHAPALVDEHINDGIAKHQYQNWDLGINSSPTGVAVTSSGSVVVTDNGVMCLTVFSSDGCHLRNIGAGPYEYLSINTLASGYIWTCKSDRLECYTEEGQLMQEILTTEPTSVVEMTPPNRLIICTNRRFQVIAYNNQHQMVHTWSMKDTHPTSIASLNNGEVIVTDKLRSRAFVLFQFVSQRDIGSNILKKPSSVFVTEDNILLLTDSPEHEHGKQRVTAWTLQGKLLHTMVCGGGMLYGVTRLPDGRICAVDKQNDCLVVFAPLPSPVSSKRTSLKK